MAAETAQEKADREAKEAAAKAAVEKAEADAKAADELAEANAKIADLQAQLEAAQTEAASVAGLGPVTVTTKTDKESGTVTLVPVTEGD